MDYQKLYTMLFNRITDAIELIDELDIRGARECLVSAQRETENVYIESE